MGVLAFAEVPGRCGFDFDAAGFAGEMVAETAPWPVFGPGNEATYDWVTVDVLQFFNVLSVGEDVEVIVAGLPELFAVALETLGGFSL